jgi:hypothetical protein
MSASKTKVKRIGFSTGALEKGDYKSALTWLRKKNVKTVELSALRLEEIEPMVNELESLSVCDFQYVSFHAPSSFPKEAERQVVLLLRKVANCGWNIVVHPDVIKRPALWKQFGSQLLIENMDRRKSTGRTVHELEVIFQKLPHARLCLDVAHARQLDTTLTLLSQIISQFSSRIAQIHISELDSWYQHQPMSCGAVMDYKKVAKHFSSSLPVIIESMLDSECIEKRRTRLRIDEFCMAWMAMAPYGMHTDFSEDFLNRESERNILALLKTPNVRRKGRGIFLSSDIHLSAR